MEKALELTAIWLREFNANLSTVGYKQNESALWTKHYNDSEKVKWERRCVAYFDVGVDEFGPLFSEESSREINPLPLLTLLAKWLNQTPPLEMKMQQEIFEALEKAGYRR